MIELLTPKSAEAREASAQVHCLDTTWDASHGIPCSLIPFLNRPFLHHVADRLVEQGYRSISFVCHHDKTDFQNCMGTGVRWGARFRFVSPNEESDRDGAVDACPGASVASHSLPNSTGANPNKGMIRVDSPEHYLESQRTLMQDGLADSLTVEREVGKSVWVGRNVRIHPSANIDGPVVIGENTRVGAGVYLGPCTVIGANCVLGRNSFISASSVMPNLFIGEGLAIAQAIVFGNRLFNVRLGASIHVADNLVVSQIR